MLKSLLQIYNQAATEALVETLRMLIDLQPQLMVLLSHAVRFPTSCKYFTVDAVGEVMLREPIPLPTTKGATS